MYKNNIKICLHLQQMGVTKRCCLCHDSNICMVVNVQCIIHRAMCYHFFRRELWLYKGYLYIQKNF